MKRLLSLFIIMLSTVVFFSCSDDDFTEETEDPTAHDTITPNIKLKRTVIAYITGDNSLSIDISSDIKEMITGSKSMDDSCRLIIFADMSGKNPYIAEIRKGKQTVCKSYDNDFYSTSPDSMQNILQWIVNNYPAYEYATIFEGHGSGSVEAKDTVTTNLLSFRAYGPDGAGTDSGTSTSKWLNTATMAKVLDSIHDINGNNIKFQFIFFDCCSMQTAEMAYELRNATDYIISPVSETPTSGADYSKIVPVLSAGKDSVGKEIISNYGTKNFCISAVKTSGMYTLLSHTKAALQEIASAIPDTKKKLDVSSCIYYYTLDGVPCLHDMKSVMYQMHGQGLLSQETFDKWKEALDTTVVFKQMYPSWTSSLNVSFTAFHVNDDTYGGISMIVPREGNGYEYIEGITGMTSRITCQPILQSMFTLQWCNAVGWHDLGW